MRFSAAALVLAASAGLATPATAKGGAATGRRMSPVPFTRVGIDDVFWTPRRRTNCEVSVPHQYAMNEETGRIDAWRLRWKPGTEPVPHIFWDSDVAKWIESASYCLADKRDPVMEGHIDEVVELMAKAQLPDGYLNSHFIQVEPQMRWRNLGQWHELYCAGHLMEAAVAYYQATGKRRMLDVIVRYADHIDSWFGPGKHAGTSGHPEIELALVKLFRATGDRRYLDLSLFFLNQRGQKPSVFQREMERLTPEQSAGNRAFFVRPDGSFNTEYNQDHLPVREQTEPVGHAVRAMYLYSGMADVGALTGDRSLVDADLRIFENLTTKRMYLTGGIGPSGSNEGFTADYDLPNESAYCETCASVGLVLWAHRLLQIEGEGRFADVLERALYNGALAGIALDGKRFFYENPLASRGGHHRQGWFGCACCPGNISRLLASLGGYVYSESPEGAWVHLYVQGRASLDLGRAEGRPAPGDPLPLGGTGRTQRGAGRAPPLRAAPARPGLGQGREGVGERRVRRRGRAREGLRPRRAHVDEGRPRDPRPAHAGRARPREPGGAAGRGPGGAAAGAARVLPRGRGPPVPARPGRPAPLLPARAPVRAGPARRADGGRGRSLPPRRRRLARCPLPREAGRRHDRPRPRRALLRLGPPRGGRDAGLAARGVRRSRAQNACPRVRTQRQRFSPGSGSRM